MAPTAHVDLLFAANRRLLRDAARLGEPEHRHAPPGLLEEREGVCLYVLARRAAELGDAVEIGAFRGRSTWYIARALEDSDTARRVVSIDPHLEGTEKDYAANVAASGLAHRVDVRVSYSHDVVGDVDGAIGLLWIDGDHSYAGVRRDFDDWFPRLERGGWIAFHDTLNLWHGPTRLVRELLAQRDDLVDVGVMGTITFARKVSPSLGHRLGAVRARAGFELATAARARHFGRRPVHACPGER